LGAAFKVEGSAGLTQTAVNVELKIRAGASSPPPHQPTLPAAATTTLSLTSHVLDTWLRVECTTLTRVLSRTLL